MLLNVVVLLQSGGLLGSASCCLLSELGCNDVEFERKQFVAFTLHCGFVTFDTFSATFSLLVDRGSGRWVLLPVV